MRHPEATEGVIREITDHRVKLLGFIKFFPVLGRRVPVEERGHKTQITLDADMWDDSGTIAEMVSYQAVDLYVFYDGVVKSNEPFKRLVGRQINRHHLTRGHLRYITEKVPNICAEAGQCSGSTF